MTCKQLTILYKELVLEKVWDNQYFVFLLNELIAEHDLNLRDRLQRADSYSQLLNEQAEILIHKTIEYLRNEEVAFLIASGQILDN